MITEKSARKFVIYRLEFHRPIHYFALTDDKHIKTL